ncbi:MAG TPA: hypothetical protein VHB21_24980 [Minicystis sp.]|nr:hypothetical protein [Minicystis sp.]
MAYRDEREALRERIAALEEEVAELRPEAERARQLDGKAKQLAKELKRLRPRPARPELRARRPVPRSVLAGAFAVVATACLIAGYRFVPATRGERAPAPVLPAPPPKPPELPAPRTAFAPNLANEPLLFHERAGLIGVWGSCVGDGWSGGAGLRAIDPKTGHAAWTACDLGPAAGKPRGVATASAAVVWTGSALVGVASSTGHRTWRVEAPDRKLAELCPAGRAGHVVARFVDAPAWDLDAERGGPVTLDAASDEARCAAGATAWTSRGNDAKHAVVDASSPDALVPRPYPGAVSGKVLDEHTWLVLFARAGRPAAELRGTAVLWTAELPVPNGVEPDGTPPSAALATRDGIYVVYQPNKEHGLSAARLAPGSGEVTWRAPIGVDGSTLHAVTGVARAGDALVVLEPWHLFGVSALDGTAGFDLP